MAFMDYHGFEYVSESLTERKAHHAPIPFLAFFFIWKKISSWKYQNDSDNVDVEAGNQIRTKRLGNEKKEKFVIVVCVCLSSMFILHKQCFCFTPMPLFVLSDSNEVRK